MEILIVVQVVLVNLVQEYREAPHVLNGPYSSVDGFLLLTLHRGLFLLSSGWRMRRLVRVGRGQINVVRGWL